MAVITIAEEIRDHIEKRILEKEWHVGDKIPSENQLCAEYSASRITVRNALQKLQAQNLIVTRPGKGSFVIANSSKINGDRPTTKLDFSQNEYKYFIEFRKAIEIFSVDLLCERGTSEDFSRIEKGLNLMCHNKLNSEKYNEGDILFHTSIIKGSHNPMFISILDECVGEYQKFMINLSIKNPGSYEAAIDNHTRIFNALLARDPQKAKNILESTIEYHYRRLKNSFANSSL